MASILIVDDDRDLAEAIAHTLQAEGYEARVALNGREGLDRIYERRPDLILLDVEMPILDGPAMLRRLESQATAPERFAVVLVSAVPDIAEMAAALSVRHQLRKPFTLEALLGTVARALEEIRATAGGVTRR